MTRATPERISRAPTICAVRALRPPESSRFTDASRLAHWSNPQPITMPSRKERLWENATRPKPLLPRTRDTYGSVISGTTRFPICTRCERQGVLGDRVPYRLQAAPQQAHVTPFRAVSA